MAQSSITQGPGNLVPDSETKMYLAAGAITAGQLVRLSGATGYTVAAGTNALAPIGVAEETVASGKWLEVTVSGYTGQTLTTSGAADAGDLLVAAASGACVAVAPASVTEAQHGLVVGQALASDVSNALVGVTVFKKV